VEFEIEAQLTLISGFEIVLCKSYLLHGPEREKKEKQYVGEMHQFCELYSRSNSTWIFITL